MIEILILPRADAHYWFLISEFNDHVLAQGKAQTHKTALKHAHEAQSVYLDYLNG